MVYNADTAFFGGIDASSSAAWMTLNSSSLTVYSSGNSSFAGNLGIGTASPSSKLTVIGANTTDVNAYVNTGGLNVYSNDTAAINKGGVLTLGGSYTGTTPVGFASIRGAKENATDGHASGFLAFYNTVSGTGSVESMRITSAGNVGIGITTPLAKFDVRSNISTANAGEQFGSYLSTNYTVADTGYKQGLRVNTYSNNTTGAIANLVGIISVSSNLGVGGTTTRSSNYWSRVDVGDGHTVSEAINIEVMNGSKTGTGAMTNQYGLYVNTLTSATNNYAIYTNGATKSYFGGNVGIGTTNPQSNLHVYGGASGITPYANSTLTIEDDTSAYISIITPNANERGLFFGEAASNIAGGIIYNNASTPDGFQFRVNGNSTKMIIDSNGNIGIGTTAPTSILHTIASGAKTAAYTGNLLTNTATSSTASIAKIGLDIQSTGTWNGASAVNTGLNVNVSGGTTNYAATFMGGNVGIGTTAPTTNLHITGSGSTSLKVESTGSTSYPGLSVVNDGNKSANLGIAGSGSALTGPLAPNTGYVSSNGAGGLAFYSVDASAPIAFYLAGASSANEKLRITSTGNVGIGTTTPTGGKLEITGDGSGVNSTIRANNTNNANSATMGVYSNSVGGFFRAYGSTFSVSSLASKAAFGPDGANGIVVFSNAGSASGGTGSISLRGGGYDTAAEKLYIDKDGSYFTGNVGIGITIPLGKLHTSESSSLNLPLFERSGQTTDTLLMGAKILATKTTDMADGFGSAIGFAIKDDFGSISMVGLIGAERRGADSTGDIIFKPYLSGTSNERMRITSAGNVGIGTTAPSSKFEIGSSDLGNGVAGPVITLGRNTNATATGAGSINFMKKDGTAGYVWQDNAGNMRINTSAPTNALDTSGTVIGAQTSTRDTKQNIDDYSSYDEALSMIVNAPLHTFRYKNEVSGYGEDSPLAKTRIGFIADEVDDMFMVGNVIDQVSINGLLMASIKAMNLKTKDLTSLDTSIATSLGSLIKSFLGDINNGVEYLYASVIQSEKVETNMLCVGSVCVTEDQFMEIVTKNVTTNSTSSVSGTDQTGQTGGEINPTPVDGDGSNTGTTTDTTTEENPPADVVTDTPADTSSDTTTSAPLEVIEVTTDAPTEGGGTTPTE